jgi:hypothetical protein
MVGKSQPQGPSPHECPDGALDLLAIFVVKAGPDQLRMGRGFHLSRTKDFRTRAIHPYMLCGWHTRSEIPLTSMPTSTINGERIDVLIQIVPGPSPIGKTPARTVFEHSAECSLIRIEAVADFEVRGGQQISVWPASGAMQKDIEIFLFGPVWATLCHQRGLLPLHASAILADGGIIAFAGRSGAGKSTTAALMGSLDYKLFADDILTVNFDQNSVPGAWPYLRRLKLQGDSIGQLALTAAEPVSERLDKDKYFVHPKYVANDKWTELERLYLLEIDPTNSHNSIDRIVGAEAVRALIKHTYHFDFILGSKRFNDHLTFCAQLASKIAIYRLRRSPLLGATKELGLLIRAHLESRG